MPLPPHIHLNDGSTGPRGRRLERVLRRTVRDLPFPPAFVLAIMDDPDAGTPVVGMQLGYGVDVPALAEFLHEIADNLPAADAAVRERN